MGHKKRNAAARSKKSRWQSPSAPAPAPSDSTSATAAIIDSGVSNVDHYSPEPANETPAEIEATDLGSNNSDANTSSSCACIKLQCERELTVLSQGGDANALRLTKDLLMSRVTDSPDLTHRVQGTVHAEIASNKKVPEDYNKNVAKTDAERRKGIEVMVAAARLVQQKSESSNLRNDGDKSDNTSKGIDSGRGSGQRAVERRRSGSARKTASSDERTQRRDCVRSYWNSMSLDGKKDFLRIKIWDLRVHFSSLNLKDGSPSEVLDEALSFGEANKVWSFWTCCSCNEKFADPGLFMGHVMDKHTGCMMLQKKSILPSHVDKEWADMLLKFPWKPLEFNETIGMLDKEPKYERPDLLDKSCPRHNADDSKDCDGDQSCKGSLLNENWPLSDDPERAKLLERIHAIFQALIKHERLASSHVEKVIQFAMEALRTMASASGSQLSSNWNRTPLCICCLGAPGLQTIASFLHDISQSCGLSSYSDKSNVADDSNTVTQHVEIVEKINFSPDALFLVLDEQFLRCKIPLSSSDDVSSAPTSSHISYDNGIILDSDALLSWIFTGTPSGEQLTYWKDGRAMKAQQSLGCFQSFEKVSYILQSLCEKKSELLTYEEILKELRRLCLDERKRRKHLAESDHQSYDCVLKKRREELNGNDNEIKLGVITNVLMDADSIYDMQVRDLGSHEVDDCRTKDYRHRVDSCIVAAIRSQNHQVSTEIGKVDATILQTTVGMKQLQDMIETASSNDFRTILIPLVKSFLRARLEDLVKKDAIEKSNAAAEALILAELSRDSKKKTKKKKKSKVNRKNKDPKATYSAELQDQTAEEILLSSAQEADGQGSGIAVPGCDDALRLQEEEDKRRIELEAEERKLEENLEYQRCMENEAKQKLLAEQHKKILEASGEKTETVTKPDAYLSQSDGDKYAKQSTTMKDPLLHKDGFADILEDVQKNTSDGALLRTGFPSEGIPSDDDFSPDQRSESRGSWHESPTKLSDREHLPLIPGKRDGDPDQPRFSQNIHDDDGAKILRQLQAEDDDEERYQADLKIALRRSLDGDHRIDTYGTGLKNETGDYNCFLNVIIQSLWHLRRFRDEFLWRSSSEHAHVGHPCVICALFDIFIALRKASKHNRREAVAPTSLRAALSNLYADRNYLFQEGQMNDASEVLELIFDCLHQSFTPASTASDTISVESTFMCSCIAHSTFGIHISNKMKYDCCELVPRYENYTYFVYNINASSLRTMKVMHSEKPFDELLDLIELNHQLACNLKACGCGKLNYSQQTILSTPPHVFTTVLGWQTTSESVEDIKATLSALSTEIDISVLYRGLDQQRKHRLVSVVCYYGLHYNCLTYNHDREQWILYDDETVKVLGDWNDVLTECERGHVQPQVLLFEAVN